MPFDMMENTPPSRVNRKKRKQKTTNAVHIKPKLAFIPLVSGYRSVNRNKKAFVKNIKCDFNESPWQDERANQREHVSTEKIHLNAYLIIHLELVLSHPRQTYTHTTTNTGWIMWALRFFSSRSPHAKNSTTIL